MEVLYHTLETRSVVSLVVLSLRRCVKTMVNTAWEREDVSFMLVAATVLQECGEVQFTDSFQKLLNRFLFILCINREILFTSNKYFNIQQLGNQENFALIGILDIKDIIISLVTISYHLLPLLLILNSSPNKPNFLTLHVL